MKIEDKIKLFSFSRQLLHTELEKVESDYGIDLRHYEEKENDKEKSYYPQFQLVIRNQASEMAAHYELFYCLENAIRSLIKEKLFSEHGSKWWEDSVPTGIKENVERARSKELESGVTSRSNEEIDYTTFGELGEIVKKNWESFSDIFNNQSAFSRVMHNLNVLRGPIAHCSPLAPDEVDRLNLSLKDWFRLME